MRWLPMDDQHYATGLTVGVAALLLLTSALLLCVPLNFFQGLVPTPILPLCLIFIYGLLRPDSLRPTIVFLVGIVQDLLFGAAVGPWASVYLLAHVLIVWQRSYFIGRDATVLTTGFAATSGLALLLYWFEMSILGSRPMPMLPLLWQWTITVLSFPLVLTLFQRSIGRPRPKLAE
ncbi:MAG: hypothetical protein AAF788_02320 [Pseudomonadota bacterium]